MFLTEKQTRWLFKAANKGYSFGQNKTVRADCLPYDGFNWLATYDGYRLHAMKVDLSPGVYYIWKDGNVAPGEELPYSWTILISHRYYDGIEMLKPRIKAVRYQVDHTWLNGQHVWDAYSLPAKQGAVFIPVDPLPGVVLKFGMDHIAILSRLDKNGQCVYQAQALRYVETKKELEK